MRPTSFDIKTCLEVGSNYELWVNVQGTMLHFVIPLAAIEDRKCVYGYAELHLEVEGGSPVVVDTHPQANEMALRDIVAENFDRFEQHSHDWTKQKAPALPVTKHKENKDMRGVRALGAQAPRRKEPRLVDKRKRVNIELE